MILRYIIAIAIPIALANLSFSSAATKSIGITETEWRGSGEYRNTGPVASTITAIRASCGCTAFGADLIGREVAPGESLEIPLRISLPLGMPRRSSRITVEYEAGGEKKNKSFTVEVVRPQVVSISPRIVHWRTGEDLTPKVVELTVNPDHLEEVKAAIVGYELGGELFDYQILESKERTVVIGILPRSTENPVRGQLMVLVEVEGLEKPLKLPVHLMVIRFGSSATGMLGLEEL